MLDNINNQILFCDYYEKWIKVYKEGAIRKVTLEKYYMTHRWLKKLIPELKICEMTRINYQQLLNDYALCHERQTNMDFHHQLKGAILDALDEGIVDVSAILYKPSLEIILYKNSESSFSEVTISSLDEQRRIGAYFKQLDILITLHQRVKSAKIDIITKKGVLNNGI